MTHQRTSAASLCTAAFLIAAPLGAQTADQPEGDVFEISPFVVEANDNNSYRATNTLSGTRLNSSLNDVASPISVFTAEFLKDIDATNIQEAYLYSVNVENENEYAPDDSEGASVSTTNQSRVRGLMATSETRGFFASKFRGDTYNSERFTVSRGPNSILYGVGSPAGLMNTSLKRAMVGQDKLGLSLRFDSENGRRLTTDINKVLFENKLAVRFASLDQDIETWKDPERDHERRRYGAITYRPFEGTALRANYEAMRNDRSKARSQLVRDEVSAWIEAGRPVYDHINDRISYDNGNTWTDEATFDGQAKKLWALSEDEQHQLGIDRDNGGFYNGSAKAYLHGQIELDPAAWNAIEDPATRQWYASQGTQWLINRGQASSVGNFDRNADTETFGPGDTLVDPSFNIHGFASSTEYQGENYSFVWEQKINENFFIEAAFNHEEWDRYFVDPLRVNSSQLKADPNYYLAVWQLNRTLKDEDGDPTYAFGSEVVENRRRSDGSYDHRDTLRNPDGEYVYIKNPNVGRYYVEGHLIGFDEDIEQDNLRFTASYSLDLRERNQLFGRHDIAFLYQEDEIYQFQRKLRAHYDLDFKYGRGGDNPVSIQETRNNVSNRYYLDLPGDPASGPNSINYPPKYHVADTFEVGGFRSDGIPSANIRELTGQMAVLQSRFLNDKLVTTFGFRNDRETLYRSQDLPYAEVNRDPDTLEILLEPIASTPLVTQDGDTETIGVVYHANEWLSLLYSKSSSFDPQGQYHDFDNNPLPASDGQGEEFGFMLNLMEGKLSARVNWFEQSATGDLENDWNYLRVKNTIVGTTERMIEDWWEALAPGELGVDPLVEEDGTLIDVSARRAWAENTLGLSIDDYQPESTEFSEFLRVTRDYRSEGMEMEIFARPTTNWDMRLTVGKAKAVNEKTLPGFLEFFERRKDIYEKYMNLPRSPLDSDYYGEREEGAPHPFSDPSNDNPDWSPTTPRDAWAVNRSDSLGYSLLNHGNGYARVALATEEQGIATPRTRKWRVNFISRYKFNEGRLKGFSVGTGARWRSAAAIGYLGKENPENPSGIRVPDASKPINGDSILDIDGWLTYRRKLKIGQRNVDWRLQLNVKNLFDDRAYIPISIDSYTGEVVQWSQKAPRTWSLTNSLQF
ncbi:TonB-dependent receptor plug domain-containing protein [Pelagicoccus sp. SDUM812005]|uniref:TonB-dependent receptor plug domain-containing protein n=1 Tax=Pelagicoccus sp. SDUM812005 TaxID=3041257 RepID=UPI00280FF453|nr:TonB-dependent receptor plug domain-containing protein [Pelagicoccus sp. SDUM812005]MDQ8179200.1 hypothetical protein [Pelagicoccus sp. SDUM812005]